MVDGDGGVQDEWKRKGNTRKQNAGKGRPAKKKDVREKEVEKKDERVAWGA